VVFGFIVDGTIPSELCDSTSMALDVAGTSIECYGGCLTSSHLRITGASSQCHSGRLMQQFLVAVGLILLVATVFSIIYRFGLGKCLGLAEGLWPRYLTCGDGDGDGDGATKPRYAMFSHIDRMLLSQLQFISRLATCCYYGCW